MLKSALSVCLVLSAVACSESASTPSPSAPAPGRVASTRGSAIVLSRDETVAVAANRSAGAITVLRLDPTRELGEVVLDSPRAEYDAGEGSEPWAAVVGADDDTAYVVLRGRGAVQRVKDLHGTPEFTGRVQVGPEPTAISISPSGKFLFVANWGDGTLSIIDTDTFEPLLFRDDLNQKLADSGVLGEMDTRPGLAHPRALAMTDNGDHVDDDEQLYMTEFFSQPLPGVADDPEHLSVDRNRQGFVYSFPVSGATVETPVFQIPPVPVTNYADAEMKMTACFPNQLYAAATDGPRLFVTAMCTSPRGPVGTAPNVKTAAHPAIFAIDTTTGAALPPVLLTDALDKAYLADGTTTGLRMPLIPNDIAIGPHPTRSDARSAYVTAFGADAVFRVDFGTDGSFIDVGSPQARYIDLRQAAGLLPVGIALSSSAERPFALVLNDNSQNVSVIDRTTEEVVTAVATTGKDPETGNPTRANAVLRTLANSGRRRFATGLDVWSLGGQAWSSCESCHPDGLSDGITWFFARGPRRTISTASTYEGDPPERRVMLWTGNVDEVHDVEGITRSVSGGVGGILWSYHPNADCRLLYDGKGCSMDSPAGTCVLTGSGSSEDCAAPKHTTTLLSGLNGALTSLFPEPPDSCDPSAETCDASALSDWNTIDAFIQSVRAPESPRIGSAPDLSTQEVDAGIRLFREGRCAACHGGPGWTISKVFYQPSAATNGTLPYLPPATGILDLIGSLRTTSYEPEAGFPRALNPPSQNGPAPLRSWAPVDATDAAAQSYAYDTGQANDQINCVLRAVGTFPAQAAPDQPNIQGIVARGAPPVLELRQDMKTLAFGATGFNVPSLLGLASRAPYYHAGNARTLEEAFDPIFSAHYQAIVPGFLGDLSDRASKVRALVEFLLSIDDETPIEPVPTDLGYDPVLCPSRGN